MPPKTTYIRPKLMNIYGSIWYCTRDNKGEKGIVEFDTNTNTIVNIISYSSNLLPLKEFSCCHKQYIIYIIDGLCGKLIIFDTKSRQFTESIKIPKCGGKTNSLIFHEKVHIFGGNGCNYHLIFDPSNKQIKISTDEHLLAGMYNENILVYSNQIIRFAGYDSKSKTRFSRFMVCDELKANDIDNNQYLWIDKPNYKLNQQVSGCGCILYCDHLIRFGGKTWRGSYTNTIHILNLNNNTTSPTNNQWRQLDVQCPQKSCYHAVLLTECETIHLIRLSADDKPKHFSIEISKLLGDYYHVIKLNKEKIDNKKIFDMIQAENRKIEQDLVASKLLNDKYFTQIRQFQQEKEETEKKMASGDTLQNELISMQNKMNYFTQKYNQNPTILINMELCIIKNCELSCKSLLKQFQHVKEHIIINKSKLPDVTKYKKWDINMTMTWIESLDDGKYKQYCHALRKGFESDCISSSSLPDLTASDLRTDPFKIKSFIDRKNLVGHFKSLQVSHKDYPIADTNEHNEEEETHHICNRT